MNTLKRFLLTLPMLTLGTSAFAATNLTGNYLITLTGAKPAAYSGQQLCASLVEDGSTLGFKNSGTFTLSEGSSSVSGVFFVSNYGVTFEAESLGVSYAFNGELGSSTIKGTTFLVLSNGTPQVGGTYTDVKGGC